MVRSLHIISYSCLFVYMHLNLLFKIYVKATWNVESRDDSDGLQPKLQVPAWHGRASESSAKLDFNEATCVYQIKAVQVALIGGWWLGSKVTDEFISMLACPWGSKMALKWESNCQVKAAHRHGWCASSKTIRLPDNRTGSHSRGASQRLWRWDEDTSQEQKP